MTTFIVIAIIAIALIGLVVIGQLVAIILLLLGVRRLLLTLRDAVDPVVAKSSRLLQTANQIAETVQGTTARVSDTTARVTETVGSRVERTSGLLQYLVAAPVIAVMATASGLRGGMRAWRMARRRQTVQREVSAAREAPVIIHPRQPEAPEELPRAA